MALYIYINIYIYTFLEETRTKHKKREFVGAVAKAKPLAATSTQSSDLMINIES